MGPGTRSCRQQLRQRQPKKGKQTFGVFSGKKGEKKGRKEEKREEGREFPGSPLRGAQDHLTFRPAALRCLTLVSIQKQSSVWADFAIVLQGSEPAWAPPFLRSTPAMPLPSQLLGEQGNLSEPRPPEAILSLYWRGPVRHLLGDPYLSSLLKAGQVGKPFWASLSSSGWPGISRLRWGWGPEGPNSPSTLQSRVSVRAVGAREMIYSLKHQGGRQREVPEALPIKSPRKARSVTMALLS